MSEEGVRLTNLKGRPILAVDTGREVARVVQALFHPLSLRLEGFLCEISPALEDAGDDATLAAGPYRLLGLKDLVAIGPHAITVNSAASLSLPPARQALAALVNWERIVLSRQSQSGPARAPRSVPVLDWLALRPGTHLRHRHPARPYNLPYQGLAFGIPAPSQPPPELDHLPVLTDRGEQIGELKDLLVDPKSGRLAGLLVRDTGFLRRFLSPMLIPATRVRSIGPDACIVRTATEETE
ncbi:MAG: PRC-barrel domain-containing protein [Limnochordales bacterium]|nr:PRC-barrel domain-containing protein [Limnochordales bacterium]